MNDVSDESDALSLADVTAKVNAAGLEIRGGFEPGEDDAVPLVPGSDGGERSPCAVVLLGNIGSSLWARFQASGYLDGRPDPLDDWSSDVIAALAKTWDALAVFPFEGPPFLPFLRWARRAEPVFPSRMGPLIHPEYGLWHAYRGALIFAQPVGGLDAHRGSVGKLLASSPCETCTDKPCLTTCPVGAVEIGHYNVPCCVDHLEAHNNGACMTQGCAARRACPTGQQYRYEAAQAQHHMRVFARNNGRDNRHSDNNVER